MKFEGESVFMFKTFPCSTYNCAQKRAVGLPCCPFYVPVFGDLHKQIDGSSKYGRLIGFWMTFVPLSTIWMYCNNLCAYGISISGTDLNILKRSTFKFIF